VWGTTGRQDLWVGENARVCTIWTFEEVEGEGRFTNVRMRVEQDAHQMKVLQLAAVKGA